MVKQRTRPSQDVPVKKKHAGRQAVSLPVLSGPIRLAPLALVLAFLAGCSGLNRNTTGGAAMVDPLVGGAAIKPPAQALQQTTGPTAAILPLPPPTTNSPASTAALASGMTKPFDKDHDLRIASPESDPSREGWGRQGAIQGIPTNGNGSGAVLRGIIPVNDDATRQEPLTNTAPAASPRADIGAQEAAPNFGVRLTSLEEAESLLKARGVLWHGLDMMGDTGEWKFTCIVPNRQKQGSRRTYEARDRNRLAAIQAVIDQIDKDQQ